MENEKPFSGTIGFKLAVEARILPIMDDLAFQLASIFDVFVREECMKKTIESFTDQVIAKSLKETIPMCLEELKKEKKEEANARN